jgi:hypothetical protein
MFGPGGREELRIRLPVERNVEVLGSPALVLDFGSALHGARQRQAGWLDS